MPPLLAHHPVVAVCCSLLMLAAWVGVCAYGHMLGPAHVCMQGGASRLTRFTFHAPGCRTPLPVTSKDTDEVGQLSNSLLVWTSAQPLCR